jgi:hypothetical protein
MKSIEIKVLRSDNGGEYKSNDFNTFCQQNALLEFLFFQIDQVD